MDLSRQQAAARTRKFPTEPPAGFDGWPAEAQWEWLQLTERFVELLGLPPLPTPWPTSDPFRLLAEVSPTFVSAPPADEHRRFWEWVWGIEPGVRPRPHVAVWARGRGKSTSAELAAAVLGAHGRRRYVLYVSSGQDQADKHVASVAAILTSPPFARRYPLMASAAVDKHGNQKGWRRNRLKTAAGFTIDAIGLLGGNAARGLKDEAARPDLIILDDLDGSEDGQVVVARKLSTLISAIIPAGSSDAALLYVQNLVHANSLMRRVVEPMAFPPEERWLADRETPRVVPAVEGLRVEWDEQPDGSQRARIAAGRSTWPEGQPLPQLEALLNGITYGGFLRECQHSIDPPAGGMFSHIEFRRCGWGEVPWGDVVDTQVWVDPAVTSTDSSDAQGIHVDCVTRRGVIYALWSFEKIVSPAEAIRTAILKAHELGASTVGIETNQGGDTWIDVFRNALKQLWWRAPKRPATAEDAVMPEGRIPHGWKPRLLQVKAGSDKSKRQRAQEMVWDYEHGLIVHVHTQASGAVGTHDQLEAALWRFPRTEPFDLVDARYWSWKAMRDTVRAPALSANAVEVGGFEGWSFDDLSARAAAEQAGDDYDRAVDEEQALAAAGWDLGPTQAGWGL